MPETAPPFSLLYVERGVVDHDTTRTIVERLGTVPVVEIDDHRSVFNRARQSYVAQKRRPALILAEGREPFLYRSSERIDAGHPAEFYTDQLRNCLFRCDYCFLQGMHRSGHLLLKVNESAYHDAARVISAEEQVWLNVSFLSDMLAFEPFAPLVAGWAEYADRTGNLTVEVRTKCGGARLAESIPVSDRSVFTWTLSPERFARRYEGGAASTGERLDAAAAAAKTGRRVRLAFDPVVLIDGWQPAYKELFADTFARLDPDAVEMATVGVFRMSVDYLDRIRKLRADTPVIYHPFDRTNGVATYTEHELDAMRGFLLRHLGRYLPEDKITFVHG